MSQLIGWLEAALVRLGTLSGFGTLLIMIVVCVDVAGRAIFNSPFHSGVEVSELLLVCLVFFGLAAAQQQKQNFAVDILTQHFPVWLQRSLELAGYVICLAIIVMIAWPSSKQAITSFQRGESGFGIVPFPVWPARAILALGLWLLAMQFACDIFRHLSGPAKASSGQSGADAA
jgi:TRAP-type C4-dicarboxylate transport system permease small subunit